MICSSKIANNAMSDTSDCSNVNGTQGSHESDSEAWFEDTCIEADGTDDDEDVIENSLYERELLGEDDESEADVVNSCGGSSSSEEADPASDVTFSPTSSCTLTLSDASLSSFVSSLSENSVTSIATDVPSARRKRRISSDSSETEVCGTKKLATFPGSKQHVEELSPSEAESDVVTVIRKRKLGNVVSLPSSSSSSTSSSSQD